MKAKEWRRIRIEELKNTSSEIRNINDYWQALTIVDRSSLLIDNYIDGGLGTLDFDDLPSHIRAALYQLWHIWSKKENEISF